MIKNEKEFEKALAKVNEWWGTGKSRRAERYPKKRDIFPKINLEMRSKRIVVLTGPRRVGKSVLLHQLIQNLLESGIDKNNIIYYQMDLPAIFSSTDQPLKDIIEYARSKATGRLYIFLDEIQASKEWYKWVKGYYDQELDIKFILTGSSSLRIQTDANKYLRGRTVELELFPLDFKEFLKFSDMEISKIDRKNSRSIINLEKKLKGPLEEFMLVGGFPEWFELRGEKNSKERWLTHLLSDVPKKAIYEDIAVFFNIRNPKLLDLLLNTLAVNQSRILSYEKINEVVGLDRGTLLSYIEFLKSSYLIFEIPVYGRPMKQAKAMKKYILIDQGLRNSITMSYALREDNKGFMVENIVGRMLVLSYKNVTYWREQSYEVDYVIDGIPVEVKYKNVIDNDDLHGLIRFLEKNKKETGVVITKDRLEDKTIESKRIRFVPFWMFLIDPKAIRG